MALVTDWHDYTSDVHVHTMRAVAQVCPPPPVRPHSVISHVMTPTSCLSLAVDAQQESMQMLLPAPAPMHGARLTDC